MSFREFLSAQLRMPSGLFGRAVMGRAMNRVNAPINVHTLERLGIVPGERVLEIGFGGGDALRRAAESIGDGTVVGVDVSAPMVRRARRRYRRPIAAGRIEVIESDVYRLPFADDEFDCAYTVNTVYFWTEPGKALSEIRRVLRPGGRLVVALRSAAAMTDMDLSPDVFTLYAPETAAELVRQAGFKDVEVEHRDRERKLDSVLVCAGA